MSKALKHAFVDALLSIKKDAKVDRQYKSKKTLMFNETLHLREMSMMMIHIYGKLKKHHHSVTNKTMLKIERCK